MKSNNICKAAYERQLRLYKQSIENLDFSRELDDNEKNRLLISIDQLSWEHRYSKETLALERLKLELLTMWVVLR
jgi:hypothetical protein